MAQLVEYLPLLIVILILTVRYFLKKRKEPKSFDVLDSLDMSFMEKMSLRLRILETNYGRDEGWFVEDEGRRVALLTEPCFVDMFWESYHITALSENPVERTEMVTSDNFWHNPQLVYVSRGFGLRAEFAFSSGLTGPGRVAVRGLYLPVGCSSLDRLILWLRKLFSAKRQVG